MIKTIIEYYNKLIKLKNKILIKWFPKEKESIFNEEEHLKFTNRLMVVIMPFILLAIAIVIKVIIIQFSTPKLRLSKNIKNDFKSAIVLDCNYSDLKLIFDNKEKIDVRNKLISPKNMYDSKVDLSIVLEDMISDYYATNKSIDKKYIDKLKSFLVESREKDPFEKLNESQKKLFITLRENAGSSYHLINNDLLSISDELYERNDTIERYLDKSYQSYILAIIALLLTLIQTLPMIWKKVKFFITKKKNTTTNNN